MSEKSVEHNELLTLTSDIVAAYAANNAVPSAGLPGLLGTVFHTLSDLGAAPAEPEQIPALGSGCRLASHPVKPSYTGCTREASRHLTDGRTDFRRRPKN